LFVSFQSKDGATECNQDENQQAETKVADPVDSQLRDAVSIDVDHGMDFSKFAYPIAEVNGQSPQEYPEIATPLHEPKNSAKIETAVLMKMPENDELIVNIKLEKSVVKKLTN
jgi:hypothetical protein